jgi:hypothetical protein
MSQKNTHSVRINGNVYEKCRLEAAKNGVLSVNNFINCSLMQHFGMQFDSVEPSSAGAKSESLGKVYSKEELDENIF